MQPLLLLNVAGLTPALLEYAPNLRALGPATPITPPFPAVTTTVQTTMLTGVSPAKHGVVGNGWFDRPSAEARFWQRSAGLVQAEPLWVEARRRDPSFTCANLFWWHNSDAACDVVLQARPLYKADGRKIPDCYARPESLRHALQAPPPRGLGRFPLFRYWGPLAGIESSRWIVDAGLRVLDGAGLPNDGPPTLTLVYLPHLDYDLQRYGPQYSRIAAGVQAIDAEAGRLIESAAQRGVRTAVVSEYGIEPTQGPQGGAVFLNRLLRDHGWLAVRDEDGLEDWDPLASAVVSACDHQAAHVYLRPGLGNRPSLDTVREACLALPGVADAIRIDHERAGDFTLVARPGRWFAYDWWTDPRKAPDYARTVAIHDKPGFDPRELFSSASKPAVAWKLLRKKLGFRSLMDVVPLDPAPVGGTHGRVDLDPSQGPLAIGLPGISPGDPSSGVRNAILSALFDA
ncbi:MAG: nucleotide pyrophosphatase/phosphodiesterase family protein [Planctomycetota bacterium]